MVALFERFLSCPSVTKECEDFDGLVRGLEGVDLGAERVKNGV